jgi:hypothetical protein
MPKKAASQRFADNLRDWAEFAQNQHCLLILQPCERDEIKRVAFLDISALSMLPAPPEDSLIKECHTQSSTSDYPEKT